jgi:hypothetical protein
MDNSKCHNTWSVTAKISDARLRRFLHLLCSPDMSLCDFWLFGMMKAKMKGCEFETIEDIL